MKLKVSVFTISGFNSEDLEELIGLYQDVFRGEPYYEDKKCKKCGINYGPRETMGEYCKNCEESLRDNIVPYWSRREIKKDIENQLRQDDAIILIAKRGENLVGFTWGYRMNQELSDFKAWKNKFDEKTFYIDELGVIEEERNNGIGTKLCQKLVQKVKEETNNTQIAVRTDKNYEPSNKVYKEKLGLKPLKNKGEIVFDPEYEDRIYLTRKV